MIAFAIILLLLLVIISKRTRENFDQVIGGTSDKEVSDNLDRVIGYLNDAIKVRDSPSKSSIFNDYTEQIPSLKNAIKYAEFIKNKIS